MKIKGISVGVILLLCTLVACQNNEKDYVAQIDGKYEISKQELIEHYKQYPFFKITYGNTEYGGFKEALNDLLALKLKQIDFVNEGLDIDDESISGIQRMINEELLVLYFREEYLGEYITDEVIEDYYENLGRQVSYQQIAFSKNTTDDLNELKQKANAIKQKSDQGVEFDQLIKENSGSTGNASKVLKMNWRTGTSTPQNQVIFRMPEGTVRVLETSRQIRVVKSLEVKEVELPPLETIEDEIYTILREVYAPRAYQDYDRDKANLIDRNQYEWNKEGLSQLVEWTKIDGFYQNGTYKDYIGDFLTAGNNFEILKYENGTVDLEKYLYLLNNILLLNNTGQLAAQDFKDFIDEALRTEMIVDKAKELELDKKILSVESATQVLLDEYVRLYNEKYILSKIPEQTKENYQVFYDETKDSLFYRPDKVNLRVKIYDTEQEAQDVINKINDGQQFEELFNSWKVKTYYINKEGNTDSYMSSEPNYFGDEAFKLSEGETAGPIEFVQNQQTKYAVIKASNVAEEKILTLEDIQPNRLNRLFSNYYWNKINNETVNRLREKYTIQINEKALAQLSGSN